MNTWKQQCLAKAAGFCKAMPDMAQETGQQNPMKNHSYYSKRALLCAIATAGTAVGISFLTVLAQSQPVLTIASMGTNQFQVTVTNGVAGARYELWWTPALNDPLYPWARAGVGDPGQTNLLVDADLWPMGFFQVSVGTNYNGIWDYQWANPNDPSLGALSIVIDSPTNGMVLQ